MKPPPVLRLKHHHWIAELAQDRSFADIGGLWGTVNETVSIASLSGAKKCTMVDVQPKGSKWWNAFEARCAELGVDGYDTVVADVLDEGQSARLGQFDLVHCSGILYHVSDPISFVRTIASMAREYFIIGSMLIPERIENAAGTLETPPGTFRTVPLLAERERLIIAAHYDSLKIKVGGVNAPAPIFMAPATGKPRTGPWWHLFTAETMVDICKLCGAEVMKTATTKQGAQSVLCKVG